MRTTQYLDLFVTNREVSNMKTGRNPNVLDEDSSFSQQPASSPLVFDSVKSKFYFPPVNDSISFGTVDHDAHINTQIEYSTNHVNISTSIQELNTSHRICGLDRTQRPTIIAMSVRNPQLARYLLIGNRRKFLYVEASTV